MPSSKTTDRKPSVYPRHLLNRHTRKGSCFVLMPFNERFNDVYRVIQSAVQSPELNLICRCADDFREANILETILSNIAQAEYILADLTDSNSNVFYELGIAHAIKDLDKVVLLTQRMDFVPFDLRQLRCVVYSQTQAGLEGLRTELLATLQEASRNSFRFRVYPGKLFTFAKKLVGRSNNLFEIEVECVMIGYGAVKVILRFKENSMDEVVGKVEPQFIFLSEDKLSERLNYVPWQLTLVQVEEGDTGALLTIDKRL